MAIKTTKEQLDKFFGIILHDILCVGGTRRHGMNNENTTLFMVTLTFKQSRN